ncbi:serine protease HTRA2, mitochondrial-like [Homarus americanus]|uniref:Serine protease HTRA2, mitochondrial n=1 Tax=Homarus americanus TaxID=6706 RepID=A0A8J5N787_HOMAM|nr:serine protease HTRA2, mitochondrial-like [Homarus americanus]KAG7174433.1 Serine protease HTRA2-like [Homarus americanus]
MKSLRHSAVWIQGRCWLPGQQAACRRLFASCNLCNSQTTEVPSPLSKGSSTQKNKSYIRTALGLSAGLFIGATLKTLYNNKNSDDLVQVTPLIPSVYGASPFSFTTPVETEDSVSKSSVSVSKRQVYNFIADAVEKTSDKVVYIDIKDSRRRLSGKNVQSISNGSGFIVSEDGLILTNAHVVTNRPRSSIVVVRLQNGVEYEGVVEDIDALSDLALIRIKCDNLSPITLGKSSDLRPGEFVAALGSPLSLSNTITAGVVSSVGRASKELGLRGKDIQYIQTDATITFGNSGGPLINLDGEVIGINSMTVTSGISFAIPIDYAKEFIIKAEKKKADLAKYPESSYSDRRRYLGVTMLTLTQSILQELQARGSAPQNVPPNVTHGIFIWRVVVGSPSYQAGLQPGDIVTHINNREVHSSRDVFKFLEGKGDLAMTVIRNGQRYSVVVVPEE